MVCATSAPYCGLEKWYTNNPEIPSNIDEIASVAIINGVKNGLFTGFGFLFIIPFADFSKARHIEGIESVAKSMYKI